MRVQDGARADVQAVFELLEQIKGGLLVLTMRVEEISASELQIRFAHDERRLVDLTGAR